MTRRAALSAVLLLGACGAQPAITCDYDGMIVIPRGTPQAVASDWERRNRNLALARLDDATGRRPVYDKSRLAKVQGCP